MLDLNVCYLNYLKEPIGSDGGFLIKTRDVTGTEKEIEEPDEHLLCRQCRQIITSPTERIFIDGGFEHTYANPRGVVFQIGCFRIVKGCCYIGPASDEFSWFRGYSWRVTVCASCSVHLGWLFSGINRDSFHGLILDRIVSSNIDGNKHYK